MVVFFERFAKCDRMSASARFVPDDNEALEFALRTIYEALRRSGYCPAVTRSNAGIRVSYYTDRR